MYVEQLSGVAIVEQDDTGKRTRAATENEEEGGVECGEGMPGNAVSLGWHGDVLRARNILPRRSRGIEWGGEGEEEEIVVPRSGSVSIRVVRVCFTTKDEKGVVDESDGLSPSKELIIRREWCAKCGTDLGTGE
jgi:hypothetical protein